MKRITSAAVAAAMAVACGAHADDHVIVQSITGTYAGVFSAPSPSLVAGNINENLALIPVTTGAKGQQSAITMAGLCGVYSVMPVKITHSNTVSAATGQAQITLGQEISTGAAAVLSAEAVLQLAGGPTINEVASLQDCSKTH